MLQEALQKLKENHDFKKLAVFDFDSTLFRSPMPSPHLWSSELRGKLISELAWFSQPETLHPPLLPKIPGPSWWDMDIVDALRKSRQDPDTFVLLMTGRRRKFFQKRIEQLCQSMNLSCHVILLKEPYDENKDPFSPTTMEYKLDALQDILTAFPSIQHVDLYDDRKGHIRQFQTDFSLWKSEGKISSFQIVTVTHSERMRKFLVPSLEKELVHQLIQHRNSQELNGHWKLSTVVKLAMGRLVKSCRRKILNTLTVPDAWSFRSQYILLNWGPIPCGWFDEGSMFQVLVSENAMTEHFLFSRVSHFKRSQDLDWQSIQENQELKELEWTLLVASHPNASNPSPQPLEWKPLSSPVELHVILETQKIEALAYDRPEHKKPDLSIGDLIVEAFPMIHGKHRGLLINHLQQWMQDQHIENAANNKDTIVHYIQGPLTVYAQQFLHQSK